MGDTYIETVLAESEYTGVANRIIQILNGVRNIPKLSRKRCIWELMQNAKDVPNKFGRVSVEIELTEDESGNGKLIFRHNGDPFSVKDLIGIVKQISSKDSQNKDGQTGKFGTGFISTQLLSDIIDVKCLVRHPENGCVYHFSMQLNRKGDDANELIPNIKENIDAVKKLKENPIEKDYDAKRLEEHYDTSFTYYLNTEKRKKYAEDGIADLLNTLPVTLTMIPEIKKVRVINSIMKTDMVYSCRSKELDEKVTEYTVSINDKDRKFLSYSNNSVALAIEIDSTQKGLNIMARDKKMPVLYRDFPLIGSEKFYFPFFLNGFRFNPTERRDGLLLNNVESLNSAGQNRKIIEAAVEAAVEFNDWLIKKGATHRYILASSRIPEPVEPFDEEGAEWIKNLQESWRERLVEQELVEMDEGNATLKESIIPAYGSSKKNRDAFYDLVKSIGYKMPKKEYLHEWIEVLKPDSEYRTWNDVELKYDMDMLLDYVQDAGTVENLVAKVGITINEAFSWLNELYAYIYKEKIWDEMFGKYAVIPNQQGDFKLLEELKCDAKHRIPEKLKEIYNTAKDDSIDEWLLHKDIEVKVFGRDMEGYAMENLAGDLNEFIKDKNEDWEKRQEIVYALLSIHSEKNEEYRKAIYDIVEKIVDLDEFTNIAGLSDDLWEEADNFILENIPEWISEYETLQDMCTSFFLLDVSDDIAVEWLNALLKFCRKYNKLQYVENEKIYPAQNGYLSELNDLYYDTDIAEEFKDLLIEAEGEDYRKKLLDRRILGYENHRSLGVSDIYSEIKRNYDKANDEIRYDISLKTIALFPENDDEIHSKVYDFVKHFLKEDIPSIRYIHNSNGFSWTFAQAFMINFLSEKIAESVSLCGFADEIGVDEKNAMKFVDDFIEFVYGFKGGKYIKIIEKDHGIWINQNNDFCSYSDVKVEEGAIDDRLKDLALNKHVGKDFREEIYSLESREAQRIKNKISQKEIARYIDDKIKNYDGNKQNTDFTELIFGIAKLEKEIKGLSQDMPYFESKKNGLIVGSLEDGETLDIVGQLVQDPDKLVWAKKIIDRYDIDSLVKIVEEFAPDVSRVPTESDRETGRKGEKFVFDELSKDARFKKVEWLNEKEESYCPYDIEAVTKDGKCVYIEVKSTTTTIDDTDNIPWFISKTEWAFINKSKENADDYCIARVFNVRDGLIPEVYYLRLL